MNKEKFGYKQRIHSWINSNLTIKKSKIAHIGVFATEDIKKGTILSVWGGKIYTKEEINTNDSPNYLHEYASQISEDFYSGPFDEINIDWSDLYNHSCNPNAKVVNAVFLIANKYIKKGDEITFDYASANNNDLDFECNCGDKTCRKFISNNDFKKLKKTKPQIVSNWPKYKC